MKLLKKLWPLTGICAIGATVAPLSLTSCGSSNNEMVELCNWYVPSINKLDHDIMTLQDAKELYFGKSGSWKTDTKILVEDMNWSQSIELCLANATGSSYYSPFWADAALSGDYEETELIEEIEEIGVLKSLSAQAAKKTDVKISGVISSYKRSIDSISFGTTRDDDANEYPTLSYTVSYDSTFSIGTSDTEKEIEDKEAEEGAEIFEKVELASTNKTAASSLGMGADDSKEKAEAVSKLTTNSTQHVKGKYTITNLPITLAYGSTDLGNLFYITPNVELISNQQTAQYQTPFTIVDTYSASIDYSTEGQKSTRSFDKTLIYSQNDEYIAKYLASSGCPIHFMSYYLYSIECSDKGGRK